VPTRAAARDRRAQRCHCPALNVFPVGVAIEVGDLKACESALREGGVPISRVGGRIVVHPSHACGVLLQFKEP